MAVLSLPSLPPLKRRTAEEEEEEVCGEWPSPPTKFYALPLLYVKVSFPLFFPPKYKKREAWKRRRRKRGGGGGAREDPTSSLFLFRLTPGRGEEENFCDKLGRKVASPSSSAGGRSLFRSTSYSASKAKMRFCANPGEEGRKPESPRGGRSIFFLPKADAPLKPPPPPSFLGHLRRRRMGDGTENGPTDPPSSNCHLGVRRHLHLPPAETKRASPPFPPPPPPYLLHLRNFGILLLFFFLLSSRRLTSVSFFFRPPAVTKGRPQPNEDSLSILPLPP